MLAFPAWLPGVIWCVALGLSAGNMACSLIYRLPRGEPLFIRKPFCSHCEAPLATRDLFPLFSYLFLRGRCRYCRASIPFVYTATELLTAGLFSISYLRYGFSDAMALVIALGMSLLILASIEIGDRIIHRPVLISAAFAALLLRTLWDQTIFDFLFAGLYAFVLATSIWWAAAGRKLERPMPPLSVWAIALLPAALAHWPLAAYGISVALVTVLSLKLLTGKWQITAAASAGIMLPLFT